MVKRIDSYLRDWCLPLLGGLAAALYLANYDPDLYRQLAEFMPLGHHVTVYGHAFSLKFIVNDLFMALFFGLAAKEIREAMLPGGKLNPEHSASSWRSAVNPLMATLGGVAGPIAVYLFLSGWFYDQGPQLSLIEAGWGIPTATDIALASTAAILVLGKGHPAVSFLLLLAVADDGFGLFIIAVFYPDPAHPVKPAWLLLVTLGMLLSWLLAHFRVNRFWIYVFFPGGLCWVGLLMASLHPALALVFVIWFIPHDAKGGEMFAEEEEQENPLDARSERLPGRSALRQLEHATKPVVEYGLFLFAFCNAGVTWETVGPITWIVAVSLLAGKPAGIYLFGQLASWLGYPLPDGMDKRTLLVAGIIAGMGLTVAIFVCNQAFHDGTLEQSAAKMGALLSVAALPVAFLTAKLLRIRRRLI